MADVFANNRSILHKGDGLQHVAAPPDVCKTPTPAGPVPIPYPNMAMSSALADGTKKVKINGKSVATEAANLSTSMGDEPGTAGGGVISNKFKGKMTWGTSSGDVKFEGKGVARFADVTQHNNNTFNTAFISPGSPNTGLAYGDDFQVPCEICKKGPDEHRIIETTSWQQRAFELRDELTRVDDARRPVTPGGAGLPNRPARSNKGYMVGTMICQGSRKECYAAMSGPFRPGFAECARISGFTPIESGRVEKEEMMNANPLLDGKSPEVAMRRAEFESRWQELRENAGEIPGIPMKDGYNPPGNCAAAKLLAKSEHLPLTMTEFFWSPTLAAPKSQSYDVLTTNHPEGTYEPIWRGLLMKNMAAQHQSHTFSPGSSVASCYTCQNLLYMVLCKKEKRVCC